MAERARHHTQYQVAMAHGIGRFPKLGHTTANYNSINAIIDNELNNRDMQLRTLNEDFTEYIYIYTIYIDTYYNNYNNI